LISKVPERLAVIAKIEQARKTDDTEQPGSGEGVVIIPQQINGNYSTTCVFSHTSRNAKISLAPLLKHAYKTLFVPALAKQNACSLLKVYFSSQASLEAFPILAAFPK